MLINQLSEPLTLDGEWMFNLGSASGMIRVPGCWEAQEYGFHAEGPAIYRRTVQVPSQWAGRQVFLQFGAISFDAEVQVNGQTVGHHRGMWDAFELDVTDALRPGATNEIVVTVYKPGKRFPLRQALAGFLPDVATGFGGLWQSVQLVAHQHLALDDLRVDADLDTGRVRLHARVVPFMTAQTTAHALLEILGPGNELVSNDAVKLRPGHREIDATLTVPAPELWWPEYPALYTARVRVEQTGRLIAAASQRFGFRRLSSQGDQLLLNGRPICLRGLLHWGWYPEIICPAPDADTIRDEMRRARELGFNLIKLCLYVPGHEYFDIADETGMLLWEELPMWQPQVTSEFRERAPVEYAAILHQLRHHPSIVIFSLGCELDQSVDSALLGRLNEVARGTVSDVLFCDNSGSGECYKGLAVDFADFNDYHFYCDLHYFEPLVDHFTRTWRAPRPWIFGEFCDSDGYRDLDEIIAAHGGQTPWWMTPNIPLQCPEIRALQEQRKRVAQAGITRSTQELVHIAQAQSFVVRKWVLERVRSRAGMGGYVVTGFRDTPIATSGVYDDLGRSKFAPAAFRAFNEDTVLTLGWGRQRRWRFGGDRPDRFAPFNIATGQLVRLNVLLSHTGAPLPPDSEVSWRLLGPEGEPVGSGGWYMRQPLPGGAPQELGVIEWRAPTLAHAARFTLVVALAAGEQQIENRWSLWVYPRPGAWPEGLALCDPAGTLTDLEDLVRASVPIGLDERPRDASLVVSSVLTVALSDYLRSGGRLLLLQTGDGPLPSRRLPFWREAIKLIEEHPVWQGFPHDGFTDLQFYGLATDLALETAYLDEWLPVKEVIPILRRLDARQFHVTDYIVEARVGAGALIASTLRFQGGLGDQPSGLGRNPAARHLLGCLMAYLLTI
ncbi:MAG TPA: glycoside hydrolase [Anaerolineae bacterium]|nr:glycoside hydrolase [Anaerolineae bacterium]